MDVSESKERFLAYYRETCQSPEGDDRLASCREACCTWADVEKWIEQDENFKRRYNEIWQEGFVQFQDRNRAKARKGSSSALRMELIAEAPERYGNRLRIDANVNGKLQVGADDAARESGWLIELFASRLAIGTAAPEALPEGSPDA